MVADRERRSVLVNVSLLEVAASGNSTELGISSKLQQDLAFSTPNYCFHWLGWFPYDLV